MPKRYSRARSWRRSPLTPDGPFLWWLHTDEKGNQKRDEKRDEKRDDKRNQNRDEKRNQKRDEKGNHSHGPLPCAGRAVALFVRVRTAETDRPPGRF